MRPSRRRATSSTPWSTRTGILNRGLHPALSNVLWPEGPMLSSFLLSQRPRDRSTLSLLDPSSLHHVIHLASRAPSTSTLPPYQHDDRDSTPHVPSPSPILTPLRLAADRQANPRASGLWITTTPSLRRYPGPPRSPTRLCSALLLRSRVRLECKCAGGGRVTCFAARCWHLRMFSHPYHHCTRHVFSRSLLRFS